MYNGQIKDVYKENVGYFTLAVFKLLQLHVVLS